MKNQPSFMMPLILLCLLLTACSTNKYVAQADAAMKNHEYIKAHKLYIKARQTSPNIDNNPEFTIKLDRSFSRSNYAAGLLDFQNQKWELAILKFKESLKNDRYFLKAEDELAKTQSIFAQTLYIQAIKIVQNTPDLSLVETKLKKANRIDPSHLEIQQALHSLSPAAKNTKQYKMLQTLQDNQQWEALKKTSKATLEISPNLLYIYPKLQLANQELTKISIEKERIRKQKALALAQKNERERLALKRKNEIDHIRLVEFEKNRYLQKRLAMQEKINFLLDNSPLIPQTATPESPDSPNRETQNLHNNEFDAYDISKQISDFLSGFSDEMTNDGTKHLREMIYGKPATKITNPKTYTSGKLVWSLFELIITKKSFKK